MSTTERLARRRHCALLLGGAALATLPPAARAQALVGDTRLPPDAPESAPREDARFSAELREGMAQGEALATERLGGRFSGLRTIRRQVPRRAWGGVEAHYAQAMAVGLRWRDAGVTQPAGVQPSARPLALPPQGWTDGRGVLVLVGAHPTRAEDGLLPYSLITNLPG